MEDVCFARQKRLCQGGDITSTAPTDMVPPPVGERVVSVVSLCGFLYLGFLYQLQNLPQVPRMLATDIYSGEMDPAAIPPYSSPYSLLSLCSTQTTGRTSVSRQSLAARRRSCLSGLFSPIARRPSTDNTRHQRRVLSQAPFTLAPPANGGGNPFGDRSCNIPASRRV